jgi:hypothetical protein
MDDGVAAIMRAHRTAIRVWCSRHDNHVAHYLVGQDIVAGTVAVAPAGARILHEGCKSGRTTTIVQKSA